MLNNYKPYSLAHKHRDVSALIWWRQSYARCSQITSVFLCSRASLHLDTTPSSSKLFCLSNKVTIPMHRWVNWDFSFYLYRSWLRIMGCMSDSSQFGFRTVGIQWSEMLLRLLQLSFTFIIWIWELVFASLWFSSVRFETVRSIKF